MVILLKQWHPKFGCHCFKRTFPKRDLGLWVLAGRPRTTGLKVRRHCEEAYSKASQMLGLINRTIQFKNPKVLLPLYKSIVRPHLEYCSAVWSPQCVKDKYLLERVQHRFSRMFPELKSLPYEQRLNKLGLWTLEERRNRADLFEIFKLIKGLTAVSWSHFLSESRTELPGVITGRLWKRTAVAIYAITSLLNGQWIAGTTWHKKKWMRLQLFHSKTTRRNEGDGRWTSLWNNNRSSSPMAARFEKTLVTNYC